jgi:putative hydrolase of the HAD superfamily
LVLLSNTNNIHKKYGWEKYSFLNNFNKLILSHEVGAVKPEKEIYKSVENHTKESAEKHIFIDDVKEYVEAAKQLGWDGIQFVGYENLLQELKSRKIL